MQDGILEKYMMSDIKWARNVSNSFICGLGRNWCEN